MRCVAGLCLLAGCGRIGFDASARSGDAPGSNAADAVELDAVAVDSPAACAASYTLTVGATKVRVGNPDTWLNAEKACAADGPGMHLVEIDNFTDQQVIEGYLDPAPAAWVGISDRRTDGTFLRVVGGAPTYLPWAAGQPSFAGPGCVILDPVARDYLDGDCSMLLTYVCQCDGVVEDPTSY